MQRNTPPPRREYPIEAAWERQGEQPNPNSDTANEPDINPSISRNPRQRSDPPPRQPYSKPATREDLRCSDERQDRPRRKSPPECSPLTKRPISPECPKGKTSFNGLEELLKKEVERRGISYCLTETKKDGQYRIEVSLNSFKVAYSEDSNLILAKGMACLGALKSIDERITQALDLI
jgi:hypothetical protein